MPRTPTLPLFCLAFVLLAAPARAEGDPRRALEDEIYRIRAEGEQANARVQTALAARDWANWCNSHDAYLRVLSRAPNQLQVASTRFLFAMLSSGEKLDDEALHAVDTAGEIAGRFARQRVTVGAWGALTRQGVRHDRRDAALALLEKQGVYDLEGDVPEPGEEPLSPIRSAAPGSTGPSPFAGRIPGTTESAEFLSKWQYAHMQAESAARAIQASEAELATMPSDARMREQSEKRLAEARQSYTALNRAVAEWRQKYFEAGGR